jgi:hypothetical protein
MPVFRNTPDFRIRSFGKTGFQEWVGKKLALMVVLSNRLANQYSIAYLNTQSG